MPTSDFLVGDVPSIRRDMTLAMLVSFEHENHLLNSFCDFLEDGCRLGHRVLIDCPSRGWSREPFLVTALSAGLRLIALRSISGETNAYIDDLVRWRVDHKIKIYAESPR